MGTGCTISWKTAHTHLLLHLSSSCTHLTASSGETAGQFSPAAVSMAQQRHGQITSSRLPFPALTSPSTLGSLTQAWDHLALHLMEALNFPQGSTQSLLTMTAEMKGLKHISPFNSRSKHHGCWPDAFQGASGPLWNTRCLNSLASQYYVSHPSSQALRI